MKHTTMLTKYPRPFMDRRLAYLFRDEPWVPRLLEVHNG